MLTPFEQFIEEFLDQGMDLSQTLWAIRISITKEAVKRCKGNQTKAAKLLNTHRNNIVRWYGLLPAQQKISKRGRWVDPTKCTKDM